ncbi:MAG: hypothetical protein M1514_01480 [Patescibacteria group bacterium]|nr:hypothetical protein [Patescibacteria group bacterium]
MPKRQRIDSELLYSKLRYKHLLADQELLEKHPHAVEILSKNKLLSPGKIRSQAAKLLASGALAGSLLLGSPELNLPQKITPDLIISRESATNDENQTITSELKKILPQKIQNLTTDEEAEISHLLFRVWGINAVPSSGGTRLNHLYGLIGAEQHLPRFPGDTLSQHDENLREGITPGLGAWGYFSRTKKNLTKDLIQKEKYYVAVQTLYLPDWYTNFRYLRDWYKYRKVVVVNPNNGKTIVAVIADAGPSWWTGKHFGGSPEVMAYLGLNVGMQKGPVVLYFVDDPENKVPLGPLQQPVENEFLAKK